jgi:glyoxylase I family protein
VVNVPELQGVGHIALTVTDPKRSADFYNRLFDAQTVLTVEDDIGPLTICVSPAIRLPAGCASLIWPHLKG